MTTQTHASQYDVLVVGGGAAGLSAALTLGRSRRSVVVIDAGSPRNAPAAHMQSFLSRDGMPPGELLEIGRAEVRGYGVQVVEDRVVEIARTATGFTARTASGEVYGARRVVLAMGLRDVLPEIPGVADRFGKDIIHCPYCHGWEVRDQQIGVVASGPMSGHQALLFSPLSDTVTFLANGVTLDSETRADLDARGIRVVEGAVVEVTVEGDRLTGIRLEDGEELPFEALVVATQMMVPTDLTDQLGTDMTEIPGMGRHVTVDETGKTSVDGVWAVGNTADVKLQVINAAASGNFAGAVINMDLIHEEIRLARSTERAG